MKTLVFHVAHVYFGAIDADSVSWNAGTSNSPEDNFVETLPEEIPANKT